VANVLNLKAWLGFAQREVGLTSILFLFALITLGFVGGEQLMGGSFDRDLLLTLRTDGDPADPIGSVQFEEAVRDITALGSFAVLSLVALATVGFLIAGKKYAEAGMMAFAAIGGQVLSEVLKAYFDRPRPDFVAHIVETTSASFPSGHAMMSAAIYLSIGAMLARIQTKRRLKTYIHVTALLLTLLVGASRVYLGVHYPTDVLGGWCLGAAWAILCWSMLAWLTRSKDDAPPVAS
jgi:undecaprenyl-diphosphatase